MIRPMRAVRFSDATMNRDREDAEPDEHGDHDDRAQGSLDGCVGDEQPDCGDDREHQLDPDAEHTARRDGEGGVGRGIAPGHEHLQAEREIARARDDGGHPGGAEVRDHPTSHRELGDERRRQQTLRGDPDHPHRDQRDEVGVLEGSDRVDDGVEVEVFERGDEDEARDRQRATMRTARKMMLRTLVFLPTGSLASSSAS